MKILFFKVYIDNKELFISDYISIEYSIDDSVNVYFVNTNINSKFDIDNKSIEVVGIIKTKCAQESTYTNFTLTPHKILSISEVTKNFMIKCDIEYSDDYYFYDQSLVDLFYFWDKDFYCNLKKQEYIYTFATLLYSGVPKTLPASKEVSIYGTKIGNVFHLFNVLGEKIIGEKGYIGSNLDAIDDVFKGSNCSIIINIYDYKVLRDVVNSYKEGYFEKLKEIFEENKIVVHLHPPDGSSL